MGRGIYDEDEVSLKGNWGEIIAKLFHGVRCTMYPCKATTGKKGAIVRPHFPTWSCSIHFATTTITTTTITIIWFTPIGPNCLSLYCYWFSFLKRNLHLLIIIHELNQIEPKVNLFELNVRFFGKILTTSNTNTYI